MVPPTLEPTLPPLPMAAAAAAARGPKEGAGPSGRDRVRRSPLFGRRLPQGVVGTVEEESYSSFGRDTGVAAPSSSDVTDDGAGEFLAESS